MRTRFSLIAAALVFFAAACSDAGDLIDLAQNPPERKPIDYDRTGVNNFFVNPGFGSIEEQYLEMRDVLGLRFVRVLFAWTDGVSPSPDAEPNLSFYEDILREIPSGVDVLIVLAHTPGWMSNPANWTGGNPRRTFVEKFLRPAVQSFSRFPGIVGYEVWNEPDLTVVASDAGMGLESPENYMELLTLSQNVIRRVDPARLVVMAATRSIQQAFPANLNYNKRLRDLGAEGLADIWNVHFYGKGFESVVTSGGVADFLNSVRLPIWITESGEQGPNNQLAYVEQVWPFLREEVPGIDRIYYYEFSSRQPLEQNYGLRTNDPAFPVSDLYINLRAHKAGS